MQFVKEKIINTLKSKYNHKDMGQLLNHIQDCAEQVLTTQTFNRYLLKANKDIKSCDGQDGLLINNRYFDWREFEYKKYDIVNAFLDYFTENSLMKIYASL